MTLQPMKMILSIVLGIFLLASTAEADQILAFSTDSGATFSDAFEVNVGETVTVGLYLNEIGPDTDLADDGLIGFGLDLSYIAEFGTISSADPSAFFNVQNHDVRSATGFEWEYFEENSSGLRGSTVFLGSLDFASTQTGLTNFTISDRLVGGGFSNASWFTVSANSLDENIFGNGATDTYSFSINSSAVPEPSGVILLAAMAGVGFSFRRDRKTAVQ